MQDPKLFEKLKDGVPDDWWVIVTTDRGLYAPWLYEAIQQRLLASIHGY